MLKTTADLCPLSVQEFLPLLSSSPPQLYRKQAKNNPDIRGVVSFVPLHSNSARCLLSILYFLPQPQSHSFFLALYPIEKILVVELLSVAPLPSLPLPPLPLFAEFLFTSNHNTFGRILLCTIFFNSHLIGKSPPSSPRATKNM